MGYWSGPGYYGDTDLKNIQYAQILAFLATV